MANDLISQLKTLVATGQAMLTGAHNLYLPDELTPAHEEDVDEVRKILRNLKNLQGTAGDMEQWLRIKQLPEQISKAQNLARMNEIYGGFLKIAHFKNPDILSHYIIESANHSAGSLAESVALHALELLPDGHGDIASLDTALDGIKEEWDWRQTQTVETLLDAVETALAHLTNKPINDRSPIDRLVEISNKIAETANQLRGVDTLDEPAREESIELAREILRRLRDMAFGDRSMEDAIDTGKPNDKLAFAQKIAQLIESYKNLLFEAAQFNPNILNDPRIKAANNAVGKCTHSIKLMAVKELPGSVAAAQQISADAASMPDDWKGMTGRTVDRLLKNMEGGVERAVDDILLQQEEQQQQQEEQEKGQASESSLAQGDHARRRRRRRRSSGTGMTAAASRGQGSGDKNADGIADSLQGRGNDRQTDAMGRPISNTPAAPSGLGQIDLTAVRNLGNALRNMNNEALNLPTGGAKVGAPKKDKSASKPANDKVVSPNDKGFADNVRDKNTNPRNKPKQI